MSDGGCWDEVGTPLVVSGALVVVSGGLVGALVVSGGLVGAREVVWLIGRKQNYYKTDFVSKCPSCINDGKNRCSYWAGITGIGGC